MSSYQVAIGGWRLRLAGVVAAVVALVLVMVPPAQAEERGGGSKVDLIAYTDSSTTEFIDLPCPEAPAGTTLLSARITRQFDEAPGVTFIGGGTSDTCFYLHEESDTAYGFGEVELYGELAGCGAGEGTMRFQWVATIGAPDPDTGLRKGTDVAWFVPGSGTGAFENVSAGKFIGDTDVYPDLSSSGTRRGWVKC